MRQCILHIVSIFCLSVCSLSAQILEWQQGRNDYFISFEEVNRHFIVHVPQTYNEMDSVPIVFVFHGTTGDGERFWKISKWKELGEEEGFISVFPSSWHYLVTRVGHMQTKWNTYELFQQVADSR